MKALIPIACVIWLVWSLVRVVRQTPSQAQRGPRATVGGIDLIDMIEAIAEAETGNDPHVIGRDGERGRCQFSENVWRAHTNAPWSQWAGVNCDLTREVEKAHVRWICDQLLAQGFVLTPALIASAWRYGVRGAVDSREGWAACVASRHYARRRAALETSMETFK